MRTSSRRQLSRRRDAGRERNFHQIESVELARQRHGHMAWRVRMTDQRDLHLRLLSAMALLASASEDFRGMSGRLRRLGQVW